MKKILRKRAKSCCLRNDQARESVVCNLDGERGSEGTPLTAQAVKEIVGDWYFQTCKIDVSLPRYTSQETEQMSYFYSIVRINEAIL